MIAGDRLWEFVAILVPLIVGVGTVIVVYFELRARRILTKMRIDLETKKFTLEKQDREQRLDWLRDRLDRLEQVAEPLAEHIVQGLKKDIGWAVEVLERAKLGLYSLSLFGERKGHFREEKEFLAEYFVPLILERCRSFARSGKTVYLLIDSGTTLYPFFERIGRQAVRFYEDRDSWIDNLTIATNNLPGVERLMETGRIDPNNRYSKMAVKCHVFPGTALPIYSAVTGEDTVNDVRRLKERLPDSTNSVFISLVVGNWIRVPRQYPVYPIPLARGEGHREFKEVLVDVSDEVYVVTPLGKVFFDFALDQINKGLGYSPDHMDPDRQGYEDVRIDQGKATHVKLVSTCRSQERALFGLSTKLQAVLHTSATCTANFANVQSRDVPHILFLFDRLPSDWFSQIETEFPHVHTRREEFGNEFFFVPVRR